MTTEKKKTKQERIEEHHKNVTEKFEKLIDELWKACYVGNTSYLIYQQIEKLFQEEQTVAFRSHNFFVITERNLLNGFTMSLAKLFDMHPRSISLHRLLDFAETHSHILLPNNGVNQEYSSKINSLRDELSALEPLIEKIKDVRDKRLAHLDENIIKSNREDPRYPTYDEFKELFTFGENCINAIVIPYDGTARHMEIANWDDLNNAAEVVNEDWKRRKDELRKLSTSLKEKHERKQQEQN